MTSVRQIQEILAQYRKYGWTLRRVLLCAATGKTLTDAHENLFGETPVINGEIDAAWFSRASGVGREAWELRRLSNPPFALIEVFEDEDDETVREETKFEMEQALISGKGKTEYEE